MRFTINNIAERDAVAAHIRGLDIKQPLDVVIKRKTKRRTLPQNSLYWLWLTAIQMQTGNDKDDLHEYFINKFLPKSYFKLFGQPHTKRTSTTDLDTAEFTRYLENIQRDMDEQGVTLIGPESPLFEQFYQTYDRKI